ncbi:hypothetical protein BVRB_032700, partial [Beta vulgaris subsp. vulgaris]
MPDSLGRIGRYAVKIILLAAVSFFNALGLDFVGLISIFLLIVTMVILLSKSLLLTDICPQSVFA